VSVATTAIESDTVVSAATVSTTQESVVEVCSVLLFAQLVSNEIVTNKKKIFFIFDSI